MIYFSYIISFNIVWIHFVIIRYINVILYINMPLWYNHRKNHILVIFQTLDMPWSRNKLITASFRLSRSGDVRVLKALRLEGFRETDETGSTLVHHAVRSGKLRAVQFLITERGFSATKRNNVGATPAHDAAATGKTSILRWLLQETECGVDDRDSSGSSIAHLAARFGHMNTLRLVVEFGGDAVLLHRTKTGALPLHCAASMGQLEAIKLIVERNSR